MVDMPQQHRPVALALNPLPQNDLRENNGSTDELIAIEANSNPVTRGPFARIFARLGAWADSLRKTWRFFRAS